MVSDQADAASTMLGLAAGEMAEEEFAAWIRTHVKHQHRV
jgi:prophage maintenance system killer protein